MSCEVCAGVVKAKLLETPGVTAAEVDYPGGRATVTYGPTKTSPVNLVGAVNATGYSASLPEADRE